MSRASQTRTASTGVAGLGAVVAFLLGALVASPSLAAGPYLALDVGPSFVVDPDISGSFGDASPTGEVKFDIGFHVSGAVGYRINDYFRIEHNLSYRMAEVRDISSGNFRGDAEGDAAVLGAMVNLLLDFYPEEWISPYAGVGVGAGFIDYSVKSDTKQVVLRDDVTSFAWNLMVGANIPVVKGLFLNVGYRFFATTDAELRATQSGLGSGTIEAEVRTHELQFGARYEF